jgi:hypothetical protein
LTHAAPEHRMIVGYQNPQRDRCVGHVSPSGENVDGCLTMLWDASHRQWDASPDPVGEGNAWYRTGHDGGWQRH